MGPSLFFLSVEQCFLETPYVASDGSRILWVDKNEGSSLRENLKTSRENVGENGEKLVEFER
jgi:hypothetical protein